MSLLELTREDTEEDIIEEEDFEKEPPIRHLRCPNCAERICDGETVKSAKPPQKGAKPCPACRNHDRAFAHRRYCRGDWQP